MADALKHSVAVWSDDGSSRRACGRDNVALAGLLPFFFFFFFDALASFYSLPTVDVHRITAVEQAAGTYAVARCFQPDRFLGLCALRCLSKAVTGFIVAQTYGPLLGTRSSYRHCARHCSPPTRRGQAPLLVFVLRRTMACGASCCRAVLGKLEAQERRLRNCGETNF